MLPNEELVAEQHVAVNINIYVDGNMLLVRATCCRATCCNEQWGSNRAMGYPSIKVAQAYPEYAHERE